MKRILPLILLTSIFSQASAQQNFDTVRIRPFKVAENLYMLTGSGGNMGVLTGKEGVLLIDDQYAPLSDKIKAAIKILDPGEIKFVINTHLHGDHSGGNENFRKSGATLVAHDNVRARMMKESTNRQGETVAPRSREAWPIMTFESKLNVHLNGEDLELIHLDRGHTDGDVIVFFRRANVIHTGDAYVRYGYPYIDLGSGGSFPGFINTLDIIYALANDNTRIIPGHGAIASKADVKALRDKLVDIRDQVVAAIRKGTKLEDIPGLGITDKYEAELGKGFVKGKDFVLMVAAEIKVTAELKK
ncbi:MAG: MBL fold metallo-hydrolase [Cytophagales bacterium]|nr:MBL fold metallo-hydrolase [Cytophagales bacterium]